jgi:hypothetical protein
METMQRAHQLEEEVQELHKRQHHDHEEQPYSGSARGPLLLRSHAADGAVVMHWRTTREEAIEARSRNRP